MNPPAATAAAPSLSAGHRRQLSELVAEPSHAHLHRRAFEAIYRRYRDHLYRYCLSILRDPEDAGDALQNTMMRAYRGITLRPEDVPVRPWLFRIAHNECISLVRRRRESGELGEQTVPLVASAEAEAGTRQRLRDLFADLETLPVRQRGALTMRELSGLSYDEIAAAMSTTPAAAKQAVFEARSNLQQIELGRDAGCDEIRELISARDGRQLRSRRISAHLRGCAACSGFDASIGRRRREFALVPGVSAAALLSGAAGLGGGGAGAGFAKLAAGAGSLFGANVTAQVAGGLAVIAAGLGAVGAVPEIDLPHPGGSSAPVLASAAPVPRQSFAPSHSAVADGPQGNGAGPVSATAVPSIEPAPNPAAAAPTATTEIVTGVVTGIATVPLTVTGEPVHTLPEVPLELPASNPALASLLGLAQPGDWQQWAGSFGSRLIEGLDLGALAGLGSLTAAGGLTEMLALTEAFATPATAVIGSTLGAIAGGPPAAPEPTLQETAQPVSLPAYEAPSYEAASPEPPAPGQPQVPDAQPVAVAQQPAGGQNQVAVVAQPATATPEPAPAVAPQAAPPAPPPVSAPPPPPPPPTMHVPFFPQIPLPLPAGFPIPALPGMGR